METHNYGGNVELIIDNLSKTYANGVQALKEVNLRIQTGMFGLLGPNGAGKSTLMRTIATLQDADTGSVHLDNFDILKDKNYVRTILGYLPQDFGLDPKVTAEEMLEHFAILKGIHHTKDRKRAIEQLLIQTNLFEHRKKRLGTFSGGMKQRFGIAQALLGNPKLLIVDEPTAGLDPSERVRFHNLLSEIGENIIIILSTHIVDDVSDLCTSMAVIDHGQVLYTGGPLHAIDTIKEKVWKKIISKDELATYSEKYNVLSSKLFVGKLALRVFSDTDPANGFETAEADLEDVYFYSIAPWNQKSSGE